MSKALIIIGAGGFGREVHSILPDLNYIFKGFADDHTKSASYSIESLSALSNEESDYHIAIGDSVVREKVYHRLSKGMHFPVLKHSSVILQDANTIQIGEGSILCAASVLTCAIDIGRFCLINLNCTVGHDVIMEDFCSLMPSVNLSGTVYLERGVYIGTGATVLPGVRIGAYAKIGAGSVVTKNVKAGAVVMGVPAK